MILVCQFHRWNGVVTLSELYILPPLHALGHSGLVVTSFLFSFVLPSSCCSVYWYQSIVVLLVYTFFLGFFDITACHQRLSLK